MISLLSPWFLVGAAAAMVPIVLHLLKRNPETRIKFAPVDLLRTAPVEQSARRRLRELMLLALRVAALVLLAVAFARPFFASGIRSASTGVTIVALDTSMSVSAPGQFERARQMAKDALRKAPTGDRVGVITFADTAQEVARPSGDRALASSSLDAAQPGFGATRYRAALDRAAGMIAAAGGRRSTIVVVTDLQESGWDAGDRASVPDTATIEVADVGAPPSNLSVTGARISGDQLIATIRNSGAQPREAHVSLSVDLSMPQAGERQASKKAANAVASVGASQSTDVMLPVPRGRWASVTVDDPGGIAGDNARYIVLDGPGRSSVTIVTATGDLPREAFYLEQALTVGKGGPANVEGVGASRLSAWDEQRMNLATAVVLLSTRGLERRGRELLSQYVRKGGGIFVALGPDADREVVGDILGDAKMFATGGSRGQVPARGSGGESSGNGASRTFAPADVRHPIFQPFGVGAATLGLVKFQRVANIQPSGCEVVARFTGGEPALVDCAPGGGRVLVFASDLDNKWNDFPLHATFVPFLHEAVRYLGASRESQAEYIVGETPAGVAPTPGVKTISLEGGRSRLVAVNVDPKESDWRRLSVDEFQTAVARIKDTGAPAIQRKAQQEEESQHIWQYVLALMVAILMMESLVARRTA